MNLVDIIYSNGVTLSEFLEFIKEDSSHFDLIRPHLLQITWKPFVKNFNDSEITVGYEESNKHILFDIYNKLSEFELISLRSNQFPSFSIINYFDENIHTFDLETLKKASINKPKFKELLICSDYLEFKDSESFEKFFNDVLYVSSGLIEPMLEFYPKRNILTLLNKNTAQNITRYREDLNVVIVLDIINLIELKRFGHIENYNIKTLESLIEFVDILLIDRNFAETHITNLWGAPNMYDRISEELKDVKKFLEHSISNDTDLKAFSNCNLLGQSVHL